MGMDLLELAMEVEDRFDIEIADEDYEKLRTVGDLYEYIVHRKAGATDALFRPRVCLTLVTFARLRPALQAVTGIPRRAIRTMTSSEDVLPRHRRRGDWEQLRKHVDLELPQLLRPLWLVNAVTASAVGVVALVVLFLALYTSAAIAMLFGLGIVAPLLGFALVRATQSYADLLPASCATIGGLTREVESLNHGMLQNQYHQFGTHEIKATLLEIVAEILCVPVDDITYGSRFVEDLNAD